MGFYVAIIVNLILQLYISISPFIRMKETANAQLFIMENELVRVILV